MCCIRRASGLMVHGAKKKSGGLYLRCFEVVTPKCARCLSSIILSPLNGNVKMSPYETGDISVEPEGTSASDRNQLMHQGRHGVCQSRRTPVSERAPDQALEKAYARRRGGGSGTRQPRPAQPASPARCRTPADRPALAWHLRRLQRSPSLREVGRARGLFPQSRNPAPAAAQQRPRLAELVQLDGSPHDWLEGRGPQPTALGMQDDATGKILAAQFFPSETTFGYLCLLRQLLRRHGTPLAFYGDHSGVFVRNDDNWTVEEQLAGKRQPTQFGRALEQLGVTFIAANSPQAKGRVERLWGVLQDRLTSELRLAKAADINSANTVLRKFIADYNRRFARQPREAATAWRPAPENLERICCFVHERTVSNDNVVQWEGRRFQIPQQA